MKQPLTQPGAALTVGCLLIIARFNTMSTRVALVSGLRLRLRRKTAYRPRTTTTQTAKALSAVRAQVLLWFLTR